MQALAIIVAVVGMTLTAVEAFASYHNGMFWPGQVIAKWSRPGIAVAVHGGLWSDFFFLPFVLAWVVYNLGERWSGSDLRLAVVIGFLITAGNHVNLCLNQKVPDPLGWQKEWWSWAIALHFIYMWGACTIFVAAALTKGLSPSLAFMLATVVGIHMMFGTHIPLGMLNRFLRSGALPEFLRADSFFMTAGLWGVLAVVAWYAGGWRAMLATDVVGAVWLIGIGIAVVMAGTKPVVQ